MTEALSVKNKMKIVKYIKNQQRRLDLMDWRGKVQFTNDIDEDVYAEIHIDWTYLGFTIFINEDMTVDKIRSEDQSDIKSYLTHELVHLLIDPIYVIALDGQSKQGKEYLNRVREQTVERITRIIMSE